MKYARINNGYAVDVRAESPVGCFTPNIVEEFQTVPDEVEDGWTLTEGTWAAPVVPEPVAHVTSDEEFAAIKAVKLAQINADRSTAIEAGVPYTFGAIADSIQTRPQDQVNLLTIWTAAREAQDAGITDPVIEFRAMSDTNYWLTPTEALAMTAAVRAHGYSVYQASWARKEALAAIDLESPDALEQIAAV